MDAQHLFTVQTIVTQKSFQSVENIQHMTQVYQHLHQFII